MALTQADHSEQRSPSEVIFFVAEHVINDEMLIQWAARKANSAIDGIDVEALVADREEALLQRTNYALLGHITALHSLVVAQEAVDSKERGRNYWPEYFKASAGQRIDSLISQPSVIQDRITSGVSPAVDILTDQLDPGVFALGDNVYQVSICRSFMQESAELFRVDLDEDGTERLVAFGLAGVTFHNRDDEPVDVTDLTSLPRYADWEDYLVLARDLAVFKDTP